MLKEKIKERMIKSRPTKVFSYIHAEGRMGVLLELESDTDFGLRTNVVTDFAKEVMLQICGMNPLYIEEIHPLDLDVITSSFEIPDDKPEQIQDRIREGKLKSHEKEVVLMEQHWVKDGTKTIKEMLADLNKEIGEDLKIVEFSRFGK